MRDPKNKLSRALPKVNEGPSDQKSQEGQSDQKREFIHPWKIEVEKLLLKKAEEKALRIEKEKADPSPPTDNSNSPPEK